LAVAIQRHVFLLLLTKGQVHLLKQVLGYRGQGIFFLEVEHGNGSGGQVVNLPELLR